MIKKVIVLSRARQVRLLFPLTARDQSSCRFFFSFLATRALTLVLVAFSTPALADSIVEGRVIGASDGDTLTILDSEKKRHNVRVNGIDAPEKGQAFGERSRQSLAQMAHGKDARIECIKFDRYGREVCKVWVQPLDCPRCGKTLDVGLAQISARLAWWFRRYADEQSPEDRGRYKSVEGRGSSTEAGAVGEQALRAAVGTAG